MPHINYMYGSRIWSGWTPSWKWITDVKSIPESCQQAGRQWHMTSVFGNAIWSTAFARSLTYTWVVDSTEGRRRRDQQRKSIAEKLALAGGPATGRHAWITSEFCPVVRPRRSIVPAARNDRLPSMQPTGVHLNKRTVSLSVHGRCRPHHAAAATLQAAIRWNTWDLNYWRTMELQ